MSTSPMAEDYVTFIWRAYVWPGTHPTTGDLARHVGVNASTVSGNLRRLAADGLIEYEPYGNISLTSSGEALAVKTIYRHRVLETYLSHALGLTWAQVHAEADLLEHAVSEVLIERMDKFLGYPKKDPHGDWIPRGSHTAGPLESFRLIEAVPPVSVAVLRISDESSEILTYLAEVGIGLGTHLHVTEVSSKTGLVTVAHESGLIEHLSWKVAEAMRVHLPTTAPPQSTSHPVLGPN